MQKTTNLLLNKIELSDSPPDISVLNPNWDKIESEIFPTIDPSNAPTGNQGFLRNLIGGLANRIKAITGKTNWYDSPATTIEELNTNRISKTIVTAANDFIVGSANATVAKKTLAETKTILGVIGASESATGVVELATAAETTAGTDSTRAVHPAGLKVELDKKANVAYVDAQVLDTTKSYISEFTSETILAWANAQTRNTSIMRTVNGTDPSDAPSSAGGWQIEVLVGAGNRKTVRITQYYAQNAVYLRDIFNSAWVGTWKKQLNQDDYNILFQYANDGKTAVANAVTAKGVSASPSDTFATLATKIGQINTGKKWASGTGSLTVTNLGFTPSTVIARYTVEGEEYNTTWTAIYSSFLSINIRYYDNGGEGIIGWYSGISVNSNGFSVGGQTGAWKAYE
jgi:hypothetical protein